MDDELEAILNESVKEMEQEMKKERAVRCPFFLPDDGPVLEIVIPGHCPELPTCPGFAWGLQHGPTMAELTLNRVPGPVSSQEKKNATYHLIQTMRLLMPSLPNGGAVKLALLVRGPSGQYRLLVPTWPSFWMHGTSAHQTLIDLWHQVLSHLEHSPDARNWLIFATVWDTMYTRFHPPLHQRHEEIVNKFARAAANAEETWSELWYIEGNITFASVPASGPPSITKEDMAQMKADLESIHTRLGGQVPLTAEEALRKQYPTWDDKEMERIISGTKNPPKSSDDMELDAVLALSMETASMDAVARTRATWRDTGREAEYFKWLSLNDTDVRCPLCMRQYEMGSAIAQPCGCLAQCERCRRHNPDVCFRCGAAVTHADWN